MNITPALFREGVEFLTLREFARAVNLSRETVYELVHRRALPVYRVCRKLLFKRTDVLALLERSRTDAARPSNYERLP